MRSGAVILGIAVSAVLLAVAGGLYVLASNNSGEGYRKSIDLVRQIQLLSSEWSMEVTRVKSDQFADFDSLAAFIPRMARLKDELSDTAQRIPELPDRIASDIQAYLNAIEAKEERIERFKTGYAVVRNSSRYLPLAATNVLQQAQNSGDAALVRSISSLIRDVNLYLATPTDTSRSRLTAEIKKLRETSVAYPPPLANALANLFSHAEVLVAKQGPTEELFKSATSDEVTDLTEQLSGNLRFELGKKVLLATYYDRGMLVVFAALILFWVVLALQQRTRGGSAVTRVASRPSPIAIEPAAAQEIRASGGEAADAEAPVAAAEEAHPVPAQPAPVGKPRPRPRLRSPGPCRSRRVVVARAEPGIHPAARVRRQMRGRNHGRIGRRNRRAHGLSAPDPEQDPGRLPEHRRHRGNGRRNGCRRRNRNDIRHRVERPPEDERDRRSREAPRILFQRCGRWRGPGHDRPQ